MELFSLYLTFVGALGLGYLTRAVIGLAVGEQIERQLIMRKQSNRRIRLARIPMGSVLRDQFRMQLHVAMGQLAYAPGPDPFNALAEIFNVVQVALQDDRHHIVEAAVVTAGAQALVGMEDGIAQHIPPFEGELAQVRAGVNQIDNLVGRLDISRLYAAMQTLQRTQA